MPHNEARRQVAQIVVHLDGTSSPCAFQLAMKSKESLPPFTGEK